MIQIAAVILLVLFVIGLTVEYIGKEVLFLWGLIFVGMAAGAFTYILTENTAGSLYVMGLIIVGVPLLGKYW